jgi:hypothetical protein
MECQSLLPRIQFMTKRSSSIPAGRYPIMLMGTAVQWNEDYAVTVKHIPLSAGLCLSRAGRCPVFPAQGQWRTALARLHPWRSVTAVGYNSLYMSVKGSGHTLPAMVRLDTKEGNVIYGTHDGPVAKGMSGGPVFAADGKVVGITVAFLGSGDLAALQASGPGQAETGEHLPAIRRDQSRMGPLSGSGPSGNTPSDASGQPLINVRAGPRGPGSVV